ncbi:MAG: hypothetical protein VR73_11815 [Gammaproteobacteria bacterium BRH_c0]|nr:MAG: hypothetical protein VR73_11815 [Gammaproteobacteria bacterium BRH_c0]
MYLDYFSLRQRPFLISPDPAFLYPSDSHREALAHLQYGLEREGGFILLTGEVGTGKTTLCRLLIEQLPDTFRLAYILNARLDSPGVLAGICRELGILLPAGADAKTCVELLHDNLLAAHGDNRQTLVVIEEAQNLDPEVLETLRLLTNLETSSAKLLHILLIGQPELLATLRRPDLRQLNQRVVSRCHLGPLSVAETRAYLNHRVTVAGGQRSLFSGGAIRCIHRKSQGIPRLINLLAERCLIGAFAEQRSTVSAAVVRRAATEVLDIPLASPARSLPWPAATALVVLAVLVLTGLVLTVVPQLDLADWYTRSSEVVHQSDSPLAVPTETSPSLGVFQRWLSLWGVDAVARSLDEACGAAQRRGLRCDVVEGLTLEGLLGLDHPLLVTLHNDREGLDFYLVDGYLGVSSGLGNGLESGVQEQVSVANSSGAHWLDKATFAARWSGDGQLIWRAPPGYSEPLLPGAHNPALVAFVTEALMARGYLAEPLVTGGFYTDYLAQLVQRFQLDQGLGSDGILGVRTLAGLSAGVAGVPTLSAVR